MAKNKNRRRETSSPAVTVAEKIPLVSVIIPMYNASRFISQTLESLLYQTMQDFEVVVIDDCSTDKSVKVVESFSEKFGGRLHVIKLPQNSEKPAIPRNAGIRFARGKYIVFLDSDDLFTKTALEEWATLAEEFQADVVHNDEFYFFDNEKLPSATTEELMNTENLNLISCRNADSPRLQTATDEPHDLAERVQLLINSDFHWAMWDLFCRRDFLIENLLECPNIKVGEDLFLNFACLCLSKKLLRIPNVTYIYRQRADSVSHEGTDLEKFFHKWLVGLNVGFNEFERFMNKIPFFNEHTDYRYAVLNWYFNLMIRNAWQFQSAYSQVHPAALNPLVQKEFHSDDAAFSAYLFNTVNIQRLQIMQLRAELRKFQQQ